MIKKISICFFIIAMGSLSAQSFIGKLNPYPSGISAEVHDTVKILAVLADFQEDKDGSTYGNGKFGSIYSVDHGTGIIDPLPHDKNYFENHLLFVQNYFTKVSGGICNVSYTILPDIITVSKTMRNYSPAPKSNDLTPVAAFAKEVWFKADSIYTGFNFSDYDLFLIFHAGVGRDISLPGSLGLERDLPSVYLSPKALAEIGFNGFSVNNGSYNIQNSAIIPETESRELSSSLSETFLFELSINGLLAATVASYLGLPDLFDTETGLSAIGRFGLMDGQSIFAYNGLFPPEPTAWEKSFLGWIIPSESTLDKNNYSLVPFVSAGMTDTSVLKVNLSSSEYYLIENRQRDAKADYSTVSYISQGVLRTKLFEKDTSGYYSFDIDSLEGVIVDVDEYDWALPGSGILIWHIDENIIQENIAENRINADASKRGVDVEEADGIQDIGVEFQTVFGDVLIGEGEQRDFWYSSNSADLYTNRFSSDTRPNTFSNTGANSLVTISDFSDNSNRMVFKVIYGDTLIKPVTVKRLDIPSQTAVLSTFGDDLILSSESLTLLLSKEGVVLDSLEGFSRFKPAVFINNGTITAAGVNEDLIYYQGDPGSTEIPGKVTVPGITITSPPVILNLQRRVLVGRGNGAVYTYLIGSDVSIDSIIFPGVSQIMQIAGDENNFSAIGRKGTGYVLLDQTGKQIGLDVAPDQLLLTKNSAGDYLSVVSSDDRIFIISNSRTTVIQKEYIGISGLAITDLKQDGNNYLIFNDGPKLQVYNLNGASADNFPFTDPLGKNFDIYVLAADFEGSNSSEIIGVTIDGRIFAIDGSSGKVVRGFPISAGKMLKGYPVLHKSNSNTFLSVFDTSNTFYTWNISSVPGKLFWSEYFGNEANTSFMGPALNTGTITDYFPSQKVYNYPNPVYDGKTFIRYYVSENSKINIKIFDLAGALVEELNSDAYGGSDNETEWNVSDIQSGVYLARVEASNSTGKKETKIIKIAVVK